MDKKKNVIVVERKKAIIINILLVIIFIGSFAFVAYDDYVIRKNAEQKEQKKENKEDTKKEETKTEKETTGDKKEEVNYNKDGLFINNLMSKAYYETGFFHDEYELFMKDVVKAADLTSNYKSLLVLNHLPLVESTSIPKSHVERVYKELFNETAVPNDLQSICHHYKLEGEYYNEVKDGYGCGGIGYRYYKKTTKVENDKDHIYVYTKVGFQCDDKICKEPKQLANNYSGEVELGNVDRTEAPEQTTEKYLEQLHEYKFTFTLDKENNNYYFEQVERVS